MLEFLGTLIGNILSLPGILGFAVGMMTRNLAVATALGSLVGVSEALVFAEFSFSMVGPVEMAISILVGAAFAFLGSLARRKGTTV